MSCSQGNALTAEEAKYVPVWIEADQPCGSCPRQVSVLEPQNGRYVLRFFGGPAFGGLIYVRRSIRHLREYSRVLS